MDERMTGVGPGADRLVPLVFNCMMELASVADSPRGLGSHDIVWTEDGGGRECRHVLRLDEDDIVTETADLPLGCLGLRIPAGTRAARSPDAVTIPGAVLVIGDTQVDSDFRIDARSGTITFATGIPAAALAASLRYFFARPGAGPVGIAGLRYPLFAPAGGHIVGVEGRFHPARPHDPAMGLTFAPATSEEATSFRTTLGRTVTLTPVAGSGGIGNGWDPEQQSFYAVPIGDWQLGQGGPASGPDIELLLGLSGIEFGRIGANAILRFVAGSPAYVPGFGLTGASAARSMTSVCPGQPYPVTTPWIYPIEGPTGRATQGPPRGYFSQPNRAGLYTPGPTGSFLDVLQPRAGAFPPPADISAGGATGVLGSPQASFPSAPYALVDGSSESFATYRDFESEVLTPNRFQAIAEINRNAGPSGLPPGPSGQPVPISGTGQTAPIGPTGPSGPFVQAVTPKGVMSSFDDSLTNWERLILARSHDGSALQELQLTDIDEQLRTALLSNQLFVVISDPDALEKYASVRYQVRQETLDAFRASNAPAPVVTGLTMLQRMGVYTALKYFEPDARRALGSAFDDPSTVGNLTWGQLLLREAQLATLTISDWTFDMSPARWTDANGSDATIMILKFADRGLEALIDDLNAWTLAGSFNTDPSAVQARLRAIVAEAKAAAASGQQEFDNFVEIATDGGSGAQPWNGVLFLDVYVPKSQFPPQLEGLAAGIGASEFRAHHLGISVSPVDVLGGRILMGDSSLFGLIYYEDTEDLVFTGNPYDYKVLTLKILFANSQIVSFASQIELLITQLFGEQATLVDGEHGNNIILNGNWQKHGTSDSYTFVQTGDNEFAMDSQVLSSVLITKAQFVTEAATPQTTISGQVATRFLLWGALRYRALEGFDLFSFGPLATGADTGGSQLVFSNMFVSMDFNRASPTDRQFGFVAGQMNFDASASTARPASLFRRFPLTVSGLVQGAQVAPTTPSGATGATAQPGPPSAPKSTTPRELGYLNVATPLTAGSLGDTWFGLEMELKLGTRGALAGQSPISATLLAAWAPDATTYNVAVGLRLPGSTGSAIQIAGPLKLNIGAIQMLFDESDQAYLMRFRNIALGFLGLKFPPGGQTNVLLFGDPNPDSTSSTLGWYAAYSKDQKKEDKSGGQGGQTLVLLDQGDV